MTELPDRDSLSYELISGFEKISADLDEGSTSLTDGQINTICAVHLGHSQQARGGNLVFGAPPFAVESEYGKGSSPFPYVTDPRTCEYLLKRLSGLEDVPTFIELDTRFVQEDVSEIEQRRLDEGRYGSSSGVYVADSFRGFSAGSMMDGSGDAEDHTFGLTPVRALCRFVTVLWFIGHELPPEVGDNKKGS